MKLPGRRMTFQLTPLLDLLLIVIFAQFMEVDQAAEQTESRAVQQTLQVEHAAQTQLTALRQQLEEAGNRASQLEAERDAIEAQARQLEGQQEQFGDLVRELFQVPQSTIDETVKTLKAAAAAASLPQPLPESRIKELHAAFQKMAAQKKREAVRHVLVHQEMTKHLDLWEVHIDRVGHVTFKAGTETFNFTFRDKDSDDAKEAEANFVNRVYASYKSLKPHGKSIVILLVTFDRKISYFYLRPVLRSLPQLTDRMQRDSLGSTRYEFAVMGDLGRPPVMNQK